MTAIDTAAEIDLVWGHNQVTVRIPLAGPVTPAWCDHYRELAESKNVPARAEVHPSRSWVIVALPPSRADSEVEATMDAARDLISETDSAGEPPPAAETETALRKWWARQRG